MAWDEPKHLSILCETAAADTFLTITFYRPAIRITSSILQLTEKPPQ